MMRLKPNYRKILESILFVIKNGEERGMRLTQYDIVKTMFLADRSHLADYGRPITFDNYAAMKDGPVGSAAYDILKGNIPIEQCCDETGALWESFPAPEIGFRARRYTRLQREPDERYLSESDRHALLEALGLVKQLKFSGVRDLTHSDPAYINAWSSREGKKSNPINYIDMIPEGDEELLEELVYASKN